MDLALETGVSTRHLSFVETGRARPSPELVLALAARLDVPLRERNTMLLAAGYAPRYPERSLDDPSMARARGALQRLLDTHDPYPGVVIDRRWNVLLANRAVDRLLSAVAPGLLASPVNVFRLCLHPDGLASRTRNLHEWAGYLVAQLRRLAALDRDAATRRLVDEVLAYPAVEALGSGDVADAASAIERRDHELLVPFCVELGGDVLSLFTTITTFGTPQEVTLAETAVELFFPADEGTEALLRAAAR